MSLWSTNELNKLIEDADQLELFHDLYGDGEDYQLALIRISELIDKADYEVTHLFSAPGRTELGGNHTDHNLGKVFCSAVRNDALAAVAKRSDGKIIVRSEGFNETFTVEVSGLNVRSSEIGTTNSLIRGVVAGIKESEGEYGGFYAEITSDVGMGSGLSSSASFEVLIGTILNHLYNQNKYSPEKIAQIAQHAENKYFGKPCGLMDQMASAVGGIMAIDFKDPNNLDIQKIAYDFSAENYVLLVINTGSNHADLTPAYASIPSEMGAVANLLGSDVLRTVQEADFLQNIVSIRSKLGDRSVLRAMHFYRENKRVDQMVSALEAGDFETYLKVVGASGVSSQNILQNSIPPGSDGQDQGLTYALGVSQLFIEERRRGVARVHGGGFAGSIQVYIHKDDLDDYQKLISDTIGISALQVLSIRHHGSRKILTLP
ncbi:MAG: galactokinase [Candidatus Marinimicrobia bacterium]|jgi:galactokinase|nr:galactokinase [Candidatus Neomarinimicrobiota bacterium]MBT3825273.1 galactokinase [Candidatus Neomarinimicrobiota bacterium]MBT4131171.1 galactokinase [Candidatus Neomarinimicrobiota bacterium]MBT4294283.1 galactokinase [Candidatus Neomarinimicrobiota bacterium]MBT4419263.1 galactokinase [Candidatus Neomarinimicrobiota bacterium]